MNTYMHHLLVARYIGGESCHLNLQKDIASATQMVYTQCSAREMLTGGGLLSLVRQGEHYDVL